MQQLQNGEMSHCSSCRENPEKPFAIPLKARLSRRPSHLSLYLPASSPSYFSTRIFAPASIRTHRKARSVPS